LLGAFKLVGGILCEVMNILVMIQSDNVGDVVKDFIAFGIISEIDDILDAIVMTIDSDELIANNKIFYDPSKMNADTKMLVNHF
jgi:hypothetical protein